MTIRRLFLKLRRRARLDADLEAELAFHREMATAGGNPIPFGNRASIREQAFDLWRFTWIEDFARDVVYAVRSLRRSPGLTATVVAALALGIGGTTAIFSLVNEFVLRPMPVDHPERLVAVYVTTPRVRGGIDFLSYPDLLDYAKQTGVVESIFGSDGMGLSVTEGQTPELVWGEVVTPNYFSGLGVHPIVGRTFLPEEERVPGKYPVCVLNYHFWQRKFHGDPGVAGRTIHINGQPLTIVGVAPHGFIGTMLLNFVPDIWVPLMMRQTLAPEEGNILESRGRRWINARARLRPGVSPASAEAALNVVARQLAAQYPETNQDQTAHVIPAGARVNPWIEATGARRNLTALVSAIVMLVLLIACADVANLMLARARARAREIAIRVSIGAGRGRVIRQMLTESVLLSVAGGAAGIVLSVLFGRMMLGFYPSLDYQTADLDYETRLDFRVLPFTLAVAVAAALVFGLAPALQASRADQASVLKCGSAAKFRRPVWLGAGNLLLFAQVCLSSVLLICGGLFLRSMQYSKSVDLGMDRSGIVMFGVDLDLAKYSPAQGKLFQRNLTERLRAVPGVEDVSAAGPLPLDAYGESTSILPEGYVPRSSRESDAAGFSRVAPRYFSTMGSHLVAGRPIDARDTASAPRVAVVNETMARRYWASAEAALGRQFRTQPGGPLIEVIGVARDGKYEMIGEPATPYCFFALEQRYQGRTTVLIRSRASREMLLPAIRSEVSRLDPTLPIFGVRTMPEFLNRILSIYEMGAALIGVFAAAALALAAAGIFGVLHFTIVRRTREIGIRVALGATRSDVIRVVLERSAMFMTAGLAAGLGLTLAASGLTGSLVAGLRGSDPATFAGALVVLCAMGLVTVLLATRRALRVDPIVALREE
jgi:predicted permease